MKQGTLAKLLGFALMRKWRVPYTNHQGRFVSSHRYPGTIRLRYVKSFDEFMKFYNISVNPKYKILNKAMNARNKFNPWKKNK